MIALTKEELIQRLQEINSDFFECEISIVDQGKSFDLPDLRTGAIDSPTPFVKKKYRERPKLCMRIIYQVGGNEEDT